MAILSLLNALNSTSTTPIYISLLISIATQILENMENWPLILIYYGINDSLGLRNWVERPNAAQLLQSLYSFFGWINFPTEEACLACDIPFVQRESFRGVRNIKFLL